YCLLVGGRMRTVNARIARLLNLSFQTVFFYTTTGVWYVQMISNRYLLRSLISVSKYIAGRHVKWVSVIFCIVHLSLSSFRVYSWVGTYPCYAKVLSCFSFWVFFMPIKGDQICSSSSANLWSFKAVEFYSQAFKPSSSFILKLLSVMSTPSTEVLLK